MYTGRFGLDTCSILTSRYLKKTKIWNLERSINTKTSIRRRDQHYNGFDFCGTLFYNSVALHMQLA